MFTVHLSTDVSKSQDDVALRSHCHCLHINTNDTQQYVMQSAIIDRLIDDRLIDS